MQQCPFKNILDPDIYLDGGHHAVFAQVREQSGGLAYIQDPITGVPYWAVMKRDIADYVCKNPLLFSSATKTILPKEMPEEELALSRLMLVNMDPPEHVKYRRIVRNAFTAKAVQGYEDRFRQVAKEVIDKVSVKGECEFFTEVAAELPLIAILSLCGIPMEDKQQFFEWTNTMIFTEDEDMSGEDGIAASQAAAIEVYAYAAELAQKHQTEPLNDIVGALLDGEVNDEKLSPEEFQLFLLMLIAAGNESTRSVIAHGMRLLIENPDQLEKLLANQHRAFGTGEHFCIGAHMSRLEMQVMFEEFVPRLRNPQFSKPVAFVRDYFVNGIKSMPITFDTQ